MQITDATEPIALERGRRGAGALPPRLLCTLLLLLGAARALSTSGYLFSKYTETFVGWKGEYLSMDAYIADPLLFTIRMNRRSVELLGDVGGRLFQLTHGRPRGDSFQVTHLGGSPSSRFRIEVNQRGEVRIVSDRGCETVVGEFLKERKCTDDSRQKFAWLPLSLVGRREGGRGSSGAQARGLSRRAKSARSGKGGGAAGPRGQPGHCSGKDARCLRKHGDEAPEQKEIGRHKKSARGHRDGTKGHKSDTRRCRGAGASRAEAPGIPAYVAPSESTDSHSTENEGLGESYNSSRAQKEDTRPPGGGRAGDPCHCEPECIKNKRNNMCYYHLDRRGNMTPLMKPCRCSGDEGLCTMKNKIDRYLCQLMFQDDFSAFSQLVD